MGTSAALHFHSIFNPKVLVNCTHTASLEYRDLQGGGKQLPSTQNIQEGKRSTARGEQIPSPVRTS